MRKKKNDKPTKKRWGEKHNLKKEYKDGERGQGRKPFQ